LAALAALLARTSNHPEVETPSAPTAVSFSKSRRESCSRNMEYSPSSDAQGLQPLGLNYRLHANSALLSSAQNTPWYPLLSPCWFTYWVIRLTSSAEGRRASTVR